MRSGTTSIFKRIKVPYDARSELLGLDLFPTNVWVDYPSKTNNFTTIP